MTLGYSVLGYTTPLMLLYPVSTVLNNCSNQSIIFIYTVSSNFFDFNIFILISTGRCVEF